MDLVAIITLGIFGGIVVGLVAGLIHTVTKKEWKSLKEEVFDRYSVYINDNFENYAQIDVDTIEAARNAVVMARAQGYMAYIFDNDHNLVVE